MKEIKCRIIENEKIAHDIYLMSLYSAQLTGMTINPGQFMHIQIPDAPQLLLRRPISVNSFDPDKSVVSIVYQLKGEGTRSLAKAKPGKEIDLIVPIGNGFKLNKEKQNILLIGGGIGIAPLRYIFERYPDHNYAAILGYRNASFIYQERLFRNACPSVVITTEDGSAGVKGYVTDVFEKAVRQHKTELVLACGPVPMLKAVQDKCFIHNIKSQLSLEERMGCGIGACLVCNCAIKEKNGQAYKRVCIDGPVFDGAEVLF